MGIRAWASSKVRTTNGERPKLGWLLLLFALAAGISAGVATLAAAAPTASSGTAGEEGAQ